MIFTIYTLSSLATLVLGNCQQQIVHRDLKYSAIIISNHLFQKTQVPNFKKTLSFFNKMIQNSSAYNILNGHELDIQNWF